MHGQFSDLVLRVRPIRYKSSHCSGSLSFSATFKKNSRLSSTLGEDGFDSVKFFFIAVFRSASIPEVDRASFFFSVEKVKFLNGLS